MAYTISDAHISLSYRLGETSAPSSVNEKNRRLDFFKDAINQILAERNWWFLRTLYAVPTVTNKKIYAVPSNFRKAIQLRVNDTKYDEIELEDDYTKNTRLTNSIVNLARFDVPTLSNWNFYVLGGYIYINPPQDTPTSLSITSLTSSGTTATVNTQKNHGLSDGMYVTISGANQNEYNGSYQITVVDEDTFTYTFAGSSTSPATGTITYVRNNLELWHYFEPTLPTGDTSSIVIPDKFLGAIVCYGEGRYWSMAHKRAKAADAFVEFENWLDKMRREDARMKFLAI